MVMTVLLLAWPLSVPRSRWCYSLEWCGGLSGVLPTVWECWGCCEAWILHYSSLSQLDSNREPEKRNNNKHNPSHRALSPSLPQPVISDPDWSLAGDQDWVVVRQVLSPAARSVGPASWQYNQRARHYSLLTRPLVSCLQLVVTQPRPHRLSLIDRHYDLLIE